LQNLLKHNRINDISFFLCGSTALEGLGLLYEVPRSYSDTQHSVWLL